VPPLDPDVCYAASASRDARFDGTFVIAVRTTGIYCRPSCPAITPKRANVEFHRTAAAAQQRGFRACKRCRPDATPGSSEWNVRHDVVGRAMRLIADGTVERVGVPGLASALGYSERHLHRLLAEEVGAGPLALARAQRAQTARVLIETTALRLTDVAFAAGFGSVRQFNDTIQQVFASSPSELRDAVTRRGSERTGVSGSTTSVTIRLPTRRPFPAATVLEFIGARALDGVEEYCAGPRPTYRRVLDIDGRHGIVSVVAGPDADADHVMATISLTDWGDLGTAVQRVRRMLDLDADPQTIDRHLRRVAALAPLVATHPGRRSPASVDAFETVVRAIIGQQVSVAGARTVTNRLVAAIGPTLTIDDPTLTCAFPGPDAVATAPDAALAMPTARRDAVRRVAAAVADGTIRLDVGVDPIEVRERLIELKGIGPWTADYVLMRGLGHPDIDLASDLGVVHSLRSVGMANRGGELFSAAAPWRSYAVHHLWAGLPTAPASPASRSTRAPRTTKKRELR
jgi:AraC family transcriptional regulator, regulatory protein of adaptative response / DNA-3-methyladenine glycosylase II